MRFIVGIEIQIDPAETSRATLLHKLSKALQLSTAAEALSDALGYEVQLTTEEDAASRFFEAIEATGGVIRQQQGHFAPAADPDWIDLGEAYVDACVTFGREPLIVDAPDDGDDDDAEAEAEESRDRRRGLYGPEYRGELF